MTSSYHPRYRTLFLIYSKHSCAASWRSTRHDRDIFMKKSKIILVLTLTGSLLFSACGSFQQNNLGRNDSKESEKVSETDTSAEMEMSEEAENSDMALAAVPKVRVETVRLQRYTEDGEVLLAEICQGNMMLEEAGYEKAAETVQRLFYHDMDDIERELDSYAEMAQEHYEATKDEDGWFSNYFLQTSYKVERLDNHVLSVKGYRYDYTGGAHGMGSEWGMTVDLKNGTELVLTRLSQTPAGFMEKLTEIVLAELAGREDEMYADYELYVKENLENTGWYLDAAGIQFVFNPYAIAPYASGIITVCVPYGEVVSYLKEEYLASQGGYVMRVPLGREVQDVDGTHSMLIEVRPTGKYSDETILRINGRETLLGENIRVMQAFLMRRTNGKIFLVFDMDWASDDYETFVYELGENDAVQTDAVWAELDAGNISPEEMRLFFTLNVLGTYSSVMSYALSEDGVFAPLENIYPITSISKWNELVTIRELPVIVGGQNKMLSVGSSLYITGTDNAGIVWFEGTDGDSGQAVEGEIHYERREDEYQLYIDGVSEYEFFESLPYAG